MKTLFLFSAFFLFGCAATDGLFSGLDTEDAAGIREALTIGATNAAVSLSSKDAYFESPFRIPFPPDAVRMQEMLKTLGFGTLVDTVVLTLNRAAEDAALKSKPIFIDAIREMKIADAIKIVKGKDDEATVYLKEKTFQKLVTAFRPSISSSLDKVQATKYWGDAMGIYNQFAVEKINPDLSEFVTGKALDALFVVVANEELKIRTDPLARVTDILKRVFGRRE